MAGTLRANLVAAVKTEGIDQLSKKLGSVGKGLEGLSGKFKAMGVAALGAASAAAISFGKNSISEAKKLEQSMLSVNTVFKDLAPEMERYTKNAFNIGMSQQEAAKAVTFLGSNLKQSGMEMGTVASTTTELVDLAADLAATYGYDVQEAMLGMTALFRGEYDPIEKFCVAIKQNEVNALLAARGQDKLSASALKLATTQARLDLLLNATTDSQGAMERGASSLFVKQAQLEAQFKNLQSTVGQELTPVFADFADKMMPIIDDVMPLLAEGARIAGEVISWFAQTIADLFNPTTALGETFNELTATFNTIWQQIFGKDFDLQQIFDAATWAAQGFMEILMGIMSVINAVVIETQAWIIKAKALFSGDWATALRPIEGIREELLAAADATFEWNVQLGKAKQSIQDLGDQTEIWDIARTSKASGEKAGLDWGEGVSTGVAKTDPVKDFWKNLYDEVAKQRAKIRLEKLGASEGLVSSVLGSGDDWKKVFDNVVKSGVSSVRAAQLVFKKTATGIDEIKAKTEELRSAVNDNVAGIADSFVDAFRISDLDSSNGFLSGAKKMLARLRAFAGELKKLAAQGLHPALLQQVMGLGAEQGLSVARQLSSNQATVSGLTQTYQQVQQLGLATGRDVAKSQANYYITVSGGVGDKNTIGKAIVEAIKSYERSNGVNWRS